MKAIIGGFILAALGISGLAVLAERAQAAMSMAGMEYTQTVAWVIEFAAVIAAIVIFWSVWRLAKRASDNKPRKRNDA